VTSLRCAPSTPALRAAVPLPRFAGQERSGSISLLTRTEEYGGGGSARCKRGETEGALGRASEAA
jgi:hypothetical protein